MRKICSALLIAAIFYANAAAVQFGPVLIGLNPNSNEKQINNAIGWTNHYNSNGDFGAVKYNCCHEESYNREEMSVGDLVNKYNKNSKYKNKWSARASPVLTLVNRGNKGVP